MMTSSRTSPTGLKLRDDAAGTWKTLRGFIPEPPPVRSTPNLPDRVGTVGDANKDAFSVKAINIHFRTTGRDIGTKTNQRAKQGTISRQFGPPNSDEVGQFREVHGVPRPEVLEDARELLGRNTLRRIETEMTKKHKKDRETSTGSERVHPAQHDGQTPRDCPHRPSRVPPF